CYRDKYDYLYPSVSTCDTTQTVKYQTDIVPILKDICTSCHNTSNGNSSGSYKLDAYAEVKICADNGKLVGSVKHNSGFSPMPKGGGQINDCSIKKIEKWVKAGAPNN
ncbi:MAG: hypothetical protein NTX03_04700, partial [Bacteroidetes bacterium]|nr:hypothetical protein [Bacteroidota bacterium]